jgi:FKBP-type peptidyl-prolyl cis-trans isomerase
MKHITKILYFAIFLLYSCSSENQSSKSEKELMVTFQDSLSYSMGVNIGTNLPETEINQDLLIEGLQDYWNKAEPRLDASSRNEILRTFNIMNSQLDRDNMKAMGERAMKLSRENKMKGQEFLDKNKTSEGVRVFNRSQIQYKVIAEGNGEIPDYDDVVKVHYNGYLIDGHKFDSSYDRGEPATFNVNGVIKGWTEVLQKMPVGSKWEVYIPQNLAYGMKGISSDPKKGEYVIPPSSTLIFEIELLEIID